MYMYSYTQPLISPLSEIITAKFLGFCKRVVYVYRNLCYIFLFLYNASMLDLFKTLNYVQFFHDWQKRKNLWTEKKLMNFFDCVLPMSSLWVSNLHSSHKHIVVLSSTKCRVSRESCPVFVSSFWCTICYRSGRICTI